MDRKTTALAFLSGLFALLGAWLLEISTPNGLGLTDDAISYIAAARALLAGQGFTRVWLASGLEPITHWPPGFSASLALFSAILKIDPYRSARFLNILLYGGNAALLVWLGYKISQPSTQKEKTFPPIIFGALLATLFLSSNALLSLHAQALSEPLYIFVSLLAFLTFEQVFEKEKHTKWLLLTGFLAGISYLIRYAALSLIATFMAAIFILMPAWRKRFSSLGYFLIGAIPPILAWSLRNKLIASTATNRAMQWHPVTTENALRGIRSFFSFLFPIQVTIEFWIKHEPFLILLFIFITFALLLWALRYGVRHFFSPQNNLHPEILAFTTVLYIFIYLGSLLVSLTFFDAATPLNDRILSAVYVATLVMLLYFAHKLLGQGKIILVGILILIFLGNSLAAQVQTIKQLQEDALGFASWRWREAAVIDTIRSLPPDIDVHTNQPAAVYFWTERPAYRLWDATPPTVRNGNDLMVIFFPPYTNDPIYQAWFTEMTEGLTLVQKSGLGNLYSK